MELLIPGPSQMTTTGNTQQVLMPGPAQIDVNPGITAASYPAGVSYMGSGLSLANLPAGVGYMG